MATVRRLKLRINMSVVKEGVVDSALRALKLDDAGDLPAKVASLLAHFRQKTPKADIADCSTCGGESDVTFALKGVVQCPYCGDQEVDEDAQKPALTLVKADKDGKTVKKEKALDNRSLDESMRKIDALKIDAAKNIHALASEIRRLYELELWKLRKVEGLIAYKNFKAFCARELRMSHSYAYKLIEVSKAFTAEQIESLGVSKLGLMLHLPADHRAKLLEAANKGASKRQLETKAAALKGKPRADVVTVALAFGRVEIPLFARVAAKAAPKPAKKIEDDPWAVEEMVNDLRTLYWVKRNAKGELALVIERRRPGANG